MSTGQPAAAVKALADALLDHELALQRLHREMPDGADRTEVAGVIDRLWCLYFDTTRALSALTGDGADR